MPCRRRPDAGLLDGCEGEIAGRGTRRAALSLIARADLRQRWRSWVVLGLLFGVTFGVATAAVAGARRTEDALPRLVAASGTFHAAVLPNDPAFDAAQRDAVAALPEVRAAYPFMVPFALQVLQPANVEASLLPTTPRRGQVHGRRDRRRPAARSAEARRDRRQPEPRAAGGLEIGSTMTVAQSISPAARAAFPPGIIPDGDVDFRARLHVVGISKSTDNETTGCRPARSSPSTEIRLAGIVNMFAVLRHGEDRFGAFQAAVDRVVGHPVNVVRGSELLGLPKMESITGVERDGLLLFALAVILGGVVLAGQALVRAVTAGAADLPTWRAMGADRGMAARRAGVARRAHCRRRRRRLRSSSHSPCRRDFRSGSRAASISTSALTPTGRCSASA